MDLELHLPETQAAELLPDTEGLAYIAGIIDGEGCISIDKAVNQGKDFPRFQLKVTIHIREGYILRQIEALFGGSISKNVKRSDKWATTYRWKITSKQAANFLLKIYPYLRLKQKQAYWGIHFQMLMNRPNRMRTEAQSLIQQDHYFLMRHLNKRGVDRRA